MYGSTLDDHEIFKELRDSSKGSHSSFSKYQTNKTLKKLRDNHLNNFNRSCYVREAIELDNKSEDTLKKLNEDNIFLTYFNDKKENKNLIELTHLNKSRSYSVYSLNKHKRWNLVNLMKDKCLEFRFKPKLDNGQKDSESFQYSIQVFNIEKYLDSNLTGRRFSPMFKSYFDNNGKMLNNFSYRSFLRNEMNHMQNFRNRRRFRRKKLIDKYRLVKLEKKSKKINFKNGNRNRNSGIKRRNELFTPRENTETRSLFSTAPSILHEYYTPGKILRHKRCWFKQYEKCDACTKNSEYGKKKALDYFRPIRNYRFKRRLELKDTILNDLKDLKLDENFETKYDQEESSLESLIEPPKALTIDLNDALNIKNKSKSLNNLKKNEHDNDLKHRLLIQVDKSDILFFSHIKTKMISDKDNVEETGHQDEPSSIDVKIKGSFLKFKYLINNQEHFINSVENFIEKNISNQTVNLYEECQPAKLNIDLFSYFDKEPNDSCQTFIIFDLPLNETFILNTHITDEHLENHLKNDNLKFDNIEQLLEQFYRSLVQFYVPGEIKDENIKICTENYSKTKLLFGNVLSADEQDAVNIYSRELGQKSPNNLSFNKTRLGSKIDISNKRVDCVICCEELIWPQEFFSLSSCGHSACLNCWQNYIQTKILNLKTSFSFNRESAENPGNIKKLSCLYDKCSSVLSKEIMVNLVKLDLVHKYVQFYSDLKILRSNNFVYCKNKKCGKLILISKDKIEGLNEVDFGKETVSVCVCGYMVCRFCLKDAHFPANCKQAKDYLDHLRAYEKHEIYDLTNLYTSEGKNCPTCGNYMEKNQGCNHMTCICGAHFCW